MKTIRWDNQAKLYFKQAVKYLKQESPTASEKVKQAILKRVASLVSDYAIYEEDRFKRENDGSYRSCEVYHYRITYKILKDEILILRVRHTSQDPIIY